MHFSGSEGSGELAYAIDEHGCMHFALTDERSGNVKLSTMTISSGTAKVAHVIDLPDDALPFTARGMVLT